MELSGSLREMDFAQLIGLVAHLEGVLELWQLPGKRSAQFFIKRRKLRCLRSGGEFLDPLQAKAFIGEMVINRQGAFEFTARSFRTPCKTPLNWPLDQLIISVFTQADERLRHMDALPDPDARFRLTKLANVEGSLFLRAAGELLQRRQGANAKEIASQLNLPVDQVRYYLHKLLERNKVAPAE